ncbi:CpaF family protein [Catellatospora tritici]|uniref:CpaF family protein n=1 Tax=Catellatospora tritici TaxID=2851566 RepID=UPI001C2D2AA1|nr:ATPase, T2SS/T4P/T4SS family [Catellatospora tritici]MBV1851737.1 Flp pilus assembly complex ATPase component TadA [Catellatospora tritici]
MTARPYIPLPPPEPNPPVRVNGHARVPSPHGTAVAYAGPPSPGGSGAAPNLPVPIDYGVVRQLQSRVTETLTRLLTDAANVTPGYRREVAARIGREIIADYAVAMAHAGQPISPAQEQALLDAVVAGMFGAGRLQRLLDDPYVTNVHIIGCDQVLLHHADGSRSRGEPVADSDDELVSMLQVLAMRVAATERQLSESNPELDMQLPDGSRMTVLYKVSPRPIVYIRKHTLFAASLEELRDRYGMIDLLMYRFLVKALEAGANIMVAGLAASGKTTLLRALARTIPAGEPYITLEESRELGLHEAAMPQDENWVISLEALQGHGEYDNNGKRRGEKTLHDMMPITQRLGVRRVIVGETRGREIVPMLRAMTVSRGAMCTIHARQAREVMDSIVQLACSYGNDIGAEQALRMAAQGIDLIVYTTVVDERAIGGGEHRFVSHVIEVGGMRDGRVITTTVFGPGPDGRGVPRHLPERIRDDLMDVGYDPRELIPYIEAGAHNRGSWTRELLTKRVRS